MSTTANQDPTGTTHPRFDWSAQPGQAAEQQGGAAQQEAGSGHKPQLHARVEARLGELAAALAKLGDDAANQVQARHIQTLMQVAQDATSGGWDQVDEVEAKHLSQWLESTAHLGQPAQDQAAQGGDQAPRDAGQPTQDAGRPTQDAGQQTAAPGQQTEDTMTVEATTCKKLEGDQPVEPTSEFSKDAEAIYVAWKSRDLRQGMKYRVVWVAEDVGKDAPAGTTITEKTGVASDQRIGDQAAWWSGNAWISRPTNGWPVGSYRADLYFDDQLVKSLRFTVQ